MQDWRVYRKSKQPREMNTDQAVVFYVYTTTPAVKLIIPMVVKTVYTYDEKQLFKIWMYCEYTNKVHLNDAR